MSKCTECGCSHILNNDHHYKGCPELVKNREPEKVNFKRELESELRSLRETVRYYTDKLTEVRDVIKDTCLDEVYETRWDCSFVQGELAII